MIDAEALTIQLLQAAFPSVRVVTETPGKMETVVPVAQVARIGGAGRFTLDRAVMDVDVFHADLASPPRGAALARGVAEEIRDWFLFGLSASKAAGGFAVTATNLSAPALRPWANPNLRRFGATYEVWIRPAA